MEVIDPRPGPKRGWFWVPTSAKDQLNFSPGVDYTPVVMGNERMLIHRTHLPLLGATTPTPRWQTELRDQQAWRMRDDATEPLGFKLRRHQHQAVDFITRRRGTLLGDEMRVGKTLAAIMSHDPLSGKLIVVAPLMTRAVWLGWLKRAFPALEIGVCLGSKFDPEVVRKPIIFAHYNIITRWQAPMAPGTVIFDEAHMLTNPKTLRSNAASVLAMCAERVIAMTATPIWNLPPNLWHVLGLCEPGAWGSHWDFCMRYGAPQPSAYGTRFTGISNEDELKLRLTEIMLRRLWKDVQDDLPPITRNVVVAEVNETMRRKLDVLAGKLRTERTNTVGNMAHYRKELSSLKLAATVIEAQRCIENGEPVVIWTWHRQFAEKIRDYLGEQCHMIHGDFPVDDREEIIAAWKASPRPMALISTMPVAQVGIDLSHAKYEIFAELDYTPAIIGQAEMRCYRPDRPLSVTYVVADHVVDQRIVRALVNKLGASEPLGVGAAVDAIDALRLHVFGEKDEGDMARFLDDMLASDAYEGED